mmetsp:Transcript_157995/g.278949  ORF Transcript_157995/g.278949 Transcript_157995/m.278949 type:complete len:258 (-) Transcript_157995:55-828(-)
MSLKVSTLLAVHIVWTALIRLGDAVSVGSFLAKNSSLQTLQVAPSPAPALSDGPETFFAAAGCHRPDSPVESTSVMTSRLQMTVEICFARCQSMPGMKYFALTAGNTCYCSGAILGAKVGKDMCNKKCEGNEEQVCGGDFNSASVYTMFECGGNEEEEKKKKAEAKSARIVASYTKVDGESCAHSDSNTVTLDTGAEMLGAAEKCMQACMLDRKGEDCMGFTYEEESSKCKFVKDVADGKVEKDDKTSCYFKMQSFR